MSTDAILPESPSAAARWTPPPRPDWVERINEEGRCMNMQGVVPLDEDSLINSAVRATGLSDFGMDEWREPFRIFLKALEEESELNFMGRIRTRSDILQLLEARLNIEDTYKRHPDIADQQVADPIIVVGQGRSGTSLMHNLLSAHPAYGSPMHWEYIFPCPPPEAATYKTDPRIERARPLVDQWNRVVPTWPSIHEWAADIPMEDMVAMGMNFRSAGWMGCLGQVPSYVAWIAQQDPEPGLRYLERVLKLLQYKNPREHWVLKHPLHLDMMPALLEVFPRARFVWPHRDPVRALASLVSTAGSIQWGRSDHPGKDGAFDYMTDPALSAARFNAVIDQLEAGLIPKDRIFNPLFTELTADPIGTVEAMYAHFGMHLSDEGRAAMVEYMQDNPRDSRPPHQIRVGTDAEIAHARAVNECYQRYFNIPTE